MCSATVVRHDEVVDECVVGCVVADHEGECNGVAQAKVGGYGAEFERDFGVVCIALLR